MQYRKYGVVFAIFLIFIALLTGCGRNSTNEQISSSRAETVIETVEKGQAATKESVTEAIAATEISTAAPEDDIKASYTANTKVWDIINDPAFEGYGRLIFPADRTIDANQTLREVGSILAYYTYVNTDRTVEIVNYLKTQAEVGEQVFYDIYTDEEKAADPAKKNTGLFFFRGNPGEKFAIVNAGGAFVYVGAMHDSFPHALELSKKGFNAFALIYRPGAETAPEDLAQAIAFIFEHADELKVDTADYSHACVGTSDGVEIASPTDGKGKTICSRSGPLDHCPPITLPSGAGDKFASPWGQEPLHRIINGLAPPVKRYVLKHSSALASGSA